MVTWYHGSPLVLTVLAAGSTVTQNRELARVFSHKPDAVCWEDDGRLRHTGAIPGYLYVVDEAVAAEDVVPHPRSTMPTGAEWLTQRPLRLRLLSQTVVRPEEMPSAADLAALARNHASGGNDSTA